MMGLERRHLRLLIGVAIGLAITFVIVGLVGPFGYDDSSKRHTNSGANQETATAATTGAEGETAVMSLHDTPQTVPEIRFKNDDGRLLSLADFRGKVVLLNIWATWCGPCREEMPTLDRLQAELGGPDFQVVALSIDRAGLGVVSEFYDEIRIAHLHKYIDESGQASQQLNAVGLPTTLLLDREGREIARHVGPAEWDTPEMVAFIQRQLGRQSGALWPEPAGKGTHAGASDPAMPSVPYRNLRVVRLPAREHTTSSAITKGHSSWLRLDLLKQPRRLSRRS
ncbi:TlpA family protein disulfide reductase [Fodinicurvata halophila]|uniref:TlpA family protein disulfide reductase n=1 Tax=Fodinicurvata halophila TaxID=1419723 RepID=A0ABV8UIJ7_9PROT